MATNKQVLNINYRKNTNAKSAAFQKYFGEVKRNPTLSTRGLAQHLKDHGLAYGRDVIEAVIIKLSECVPELVATGTPVKLEGIGIFYPTALNNKGGVTEAELKSDDFQVDSLIKGIRLRFLPDSSDLDNLTSTEFQKKYCVLRSFGIVTSRKVMEGGKVKKRVQMLQSWDDFKNPEDDGSQG